MRIISDKTAFAAIGILSFVVLAFLAWLLYLHVPQGSQTPAWVVGLPALNACFNASSAVSLLLGIFFIKKGNKEAHLRCMLTALTFTVAFLISYITYHHFMGNTKFLGQGWMRPAYFFILITHICLSALTLPLVLTVLFFATTGRFDRHKRLARVTFPMWLYVCVSGVAVYFLIQPYY
jgi:putative membrane protein